MARYRYRGRFVSESRARQLANLKGPSKHLTVELSARERAAYEAERRAEAARQGWETRRARAEAREQAREAARRSEAARRGWETRRREAERRSEAARRGWESRRRREASAQREAERQRRSEAARRGWETRRERERARPVPVYEEDYEAPPDVPLPEDYYAGMEPYIEPDLDDYWDSILADDFDDEDYEIRYVPTK